jgi:histidinol-phosphate aminotransferase
MSRFWSAAARRLVPYVPGEQPRESLIKLNTNECPYPPSPRVLAAIRAVDEDALRRYPDPESEALCQAAAVRYGLDAGQVFPGNGSDEVLAHVFQGLLRQERPLQFPDITYSFYPVRHRIRNLPSRRRFPHRYSPDSARQRRHYFPQSQRSDGSAPAP